MSLLLCSIPSNPPEKESSYRNYVLELTSNTPARVSISKTYKKLAMATFDSHLCKDIMESLLWRLTDADAGNWKHGLKAFQLLAYLLINGSYRVVSDCLATLHLIEPFLVYITSRIDHNRVEQSMG